MAESPTESRPYYLKLLFDELGLEGRFVRKEHETIQKRLLAAADEMQKGETVDSQGSPKETESFLRSDIFGINQCLHLASSVLLVGTEPQKLYATRDNVHSQFVGKDPATVLTVATLYHLIKSEMAGQAVDSELRKKLVYIHKRFDELNWMIGSDDMTKLGMEKYNEQASGLKVA
jgi:hypothetical protein